MNTIILKTTYMSSSGEDIARAITDRRRQIKKMKIFVFTSTVLFIAVMAWGYLKYDKANAAVTEKEREL